MGKPKLVLHFIWSIDVGIISEYLLKIENAFHVTKSSKNCLKLKKNQRKKL